MAIFTSLMNRLLNQNKPSDSRQDDHYQKLQYLQDHHDWIEVSVTQTQTFYQSLVLAIDSQNHELLIDDLYPPEDQETLQTGDTLEIISKNNVQLSFYTRILARELFDGKEAWRVELPEEIGHNHNRNAYRVLVNNEQQLTIEVCCGDTLLDDVRIINLSSEGIKLSFAEDMGEPLKKERVLTNCLIKLPTHIEVDCNIELRNIYTIRRPYPHTLAGGLLILECPQQRVKLEQYLASVQRLQRRRESRTE